MNEEACEASRSYWRSVDRLLESPALRSQPSPEFTEGADLPPDEMSRRTMMTLMGASFALAGTTACRRPVEHILPYVDAPETIVPGIPQHYASTLPLVGAGYGVLVESHEGRPTKVEGNQLHPSTLGAANAWMQASILNLYDADRSRHHRLPGTEGGKATTATWDEVVAYLQARRTEAAENQGDGLAVLSTGFASPSLTTAANALKAQLPAAQFVVYDAVGDGNVFRGIEAASGQSARPRYHLDRARTVVTLDADLLSTETDDIANSRAFAQARKVGSASHESHESHGDSGTMLRLYSVESSLSVTGAAADHRLRARRDQIPAVTAAVAAAVGVAGAPSAADLPADMQPKIELMARDLTAAGQGALVAAGRSQPPVVHALVYAINQTLGAIGHTVTLVPTTDVAVADGDALAALVTAMNNGDITTLVILGGNPAYDAPAELGFAEALANVTHSVHLSTHEDETSQGCGAHVTEATPFETWGDARATNGAPSVIQPLIAPLFEGKSALEVLGLLADGQDQSGYERVQSTWASLIQGDFEAGWRQCLHDGVFTDVAATDAATIAADRANALVDNEGHSANGEGMADPVVAHQAPSATAWANWPTLGGDFEVTFHVSRSVLDGRFANNAWQQELPDAITKIVWDNAALISPATATKRGLATGDLVRLTVAERSVELPVWILPGQADNSIALEIGYGRRAAGRVGNGVGFDVYPLRGSSGTWAATASLDSAAGQHKLVQTQEHWSMEGRPLVREATVAEFEADPHRFQDHHDPVGAQPFEAFDYSKGNQWGMAIDLNSCTGCNACVVACQSENNIPVVGKEQVDNGREMHWLRVDRYFVGGLDEPEVAVQPIPCMHCENAPCEQVCPVAATVHGPEGAQCHGLQPVHWYPLLLQQLSLQGSPVQLLQLHQGHARAAQAGEQPRRDGAFAWGHGEVQLLPAAHQ